LRYSYTPSFNDQCTKTPSFTSKPKATSRQANVIPNNVYVCVTGRILASFDARGERVGWSVGIKILSVSRVESGASAVWKSNRGEGGKKWERKRETERWKETEFSCESHRTHHAPCSLFLSLSLSPSIYLSSSRSCCLVP